jgi:hypothetical protein
MNSMRRRQRVAKSLPLAFFIDENLHETANIMLNG